MGGCLRMNVGRTGLKVGGFGLPTPRNHSFAAISKLGTDNTGTS